jgi:hypothetical protein
VQENYLLLIPGNFFLLIIFIKMKGLKIVLMRVLKLRPFNLIPALPYRRGAENLETY